MDLPINQIVEGDCLEVMRTWPLRGYFSQMVLCSQVTPAAEGNEVLKAVRGPIVTVKQAVRPDVMHVQLLPEFIFRSAATLTCMPIPPSCLGSLPVPIRASIGTVSAGPCWASLPRYGKRKARCRANGSPTPGGAGFSSTERLAADHTSNMVLSAGRKARAFQRAVFLGFLVPVRCVQDRLAALLASASLYGNTTRAGHRAIATISADKGRRQIEGLAAPKACSLLSCQESGVGAFPRAKVFLVSCRKRLMAGFAIHAQIVPQ